MTEFRSALITGATGFIGSVLARRLLEEGVKVYCVTRAATVNRSRLDGLSGIELIEVKSFHTPDLRKAFTGVAAEVVFHLASYGIHPEDRDPEAMVEGNVKLVTQMLLATADWPLKRFIHTGSCSEYGVSRGQKPLSENHPLRPISLYGAAKAASVTYGNTLASQLRVPFVTLRLFGVYGIGEGPHRLIPYLIDRLVRDQPVDLTPGEQIRDLLYVDDVVEAFVTAAKSDRLIPYTVYNVCSGIPVSVREIGEAVADIMDKPRDLLQWGARSYRADEAMWIVGDNRRFLRATGWRPKTILLQGISRMVLESQIRA